MVAVRVSLVVVAALLLVACGTRPYQHNLTGLASVKERAQTQSAGTVVVTAAIPGIRETTEIFGLPLYADDIQPVWLEVENRGNSLIRFAPVGMDPTYFTPMEVAWRYRKGYSKQGRSDMERYLHTNTMPRFIPPGETRSGFVMTHARPGTKGFKVDLYGNAEDHSFAFFIDVPGFVPDHAEVDFKALYATDKIKQLDDTGLLEILAQVPCCAADRSGDQLGTPLNVVLISKGSDILHALLSAGWHESLRAETVLEKEKLRSGAYLFGRSPDAVFKKVRDNKGERNELRLWMAPAVIGDEQIWVGQIIHYMSRGLLQARLDPDVDDARMYMVQTMLYSQGLRKFGWAKGEQTKSARASLFDFNSEQFFSDGYRAVMWLSAEPISMLEVEQVGLDRPPFR
jgi:hypothetical protein